MVVLKNRDDFYAERLPNADDILLVIEVADSSLEYDRETKLPLYASEHSGSLVGKFNRNIIGDIVTPHQKVTMSSQDAVITKL